MRPNTDHQDFKVNGFSVTNACRQRKEPIGVEGYGSQIYISYHLVDLAAVHTSYNLTTVASTQFL